MDNTKSEFKAVFSNPKWSDDFYRFLQVIYHLYPEDKFHQLIAATAKEKNSDEEIYKAVQQGLPKIKTFLLELTYALPALKKQKKEMANQVLQLLGERKSINGYLEISSTGPTASCVNILNCQETFIYQTTLHQQIQLPI